MANKVQHNKGTIRDNALKALVTSNLFRPKVERKKKGKGSYNRQAAKKWRDGFSNTVPFYFTALHMKALTAATFVFHIRILKLKAFL